MNTGKYIFSQVIDFIPRYQFDKLVKKYKGDWHAKELSCYNKLLQLLFGQITCCDSLRDICMCLEAHSGILYHLGIRKHVTHSSLSRANENRDYRIYEELGIYLIGIVRPMYSNTKVAEITIDNVLYALDSTTISTSIVLAAWTLGKYSKGAVKMHTLLDIRGSIPANIHITDGIITNNFEISALEVANLYRHRWDIEVFFKWVKQNIVVKTMWGYSENAVRTHLWVAIIAYLLIAKIKADYKSPYSITEVATLIRISALEKVDLRDLITKPKNSIIQKQNVKELTLFDDFY